MKSNIVVSVVLVLVLLLSYQGIVQRKAYGEIVTVGEVGKFQIANLSGDNVAILDTVTGKLRLFEQVSGDYRVMIKFVQEIDTQQDKGK